MPLIQAGSNKARSQNIGTEIKAGKPPAQAAAIAYSVQRKNQDAARPAAVRILSGEDPGESNLVAVPQGAYRQQAGQPFAVPTNPNSQPPILPIVSKTPHEGMSETPANVLPSEPLVRVIGAQDDGSIFPTHEGETNPLEGEPGSLTPVAPKPPQINPIHEGETNPLEGESGSRFGTDEQNENITEANIVNASPPNY